MRVYRPCRQTQQLRFPGFQQFCARILSINSRWTSKNPRATARSIPLKIGLPWWIRGFFLFYEYVYEFLHARSLRRPLHTEYFKSTTSQRQNSRYLCGASSEDWKPKNLYPTLAPSLPEVVFSFCIDKQVSRLLSFYGLMTSAGLKVRINDWWVYGVFVWWYIKRGWAASELGLVQIFGYVSMLGYK